MTSSLTIEADSNYKDKTEYKFYVDGNYVGLALFGHLDKRDHKYLLEYHPTVETLAKEYGYKSISEFVLKTITTPPTGQNTNDY